MKTAIYLIIAIGLFICACQKTVKQQEVVMQQDTILQEESVRTIEPEIIEEVYL